MQGPSYISPLIVAAAILLGLVLALWAGYGFGVHRARRAFKRLVAARQQEEEADRERLRLTLEKAQKDLAKAALDLEKMGEERHRAFSDRARFEREATESTELLREAAAIRAALESDLRKQRETQQFARDVQAALDAEIRLRQETDKALSAAGAATAKAHQQLAETKAELIDARQHATDLANRHEATQLRLTQQTASLRELSAQVELQERQLEDVTDLEQQLAAAQARGATLERELAQVTEVASTVSAVNLDREELEVRLEMAAAAVRIARKEADRYRAESVEQGQRLTENKRELTLLRATTRQQEQKLEEQQDASADLPALRQEFGQLRIKLEQQSLGMKQLAARASSAEQSAEEQRRACETLELELRQLRVNEQSHHQQAAELSELRSNLESLQQKSRELAELCTVRERLDKELASARTRLQFCEDQTQELDRLRDQLQRSRDEQQAYLEAERRLLATQAELRGLRLELEAAKGRLEEQRNLGEANAAPRRDSVRIKALGDELEQERSAGKELRGRLQVASAQLSDLERLRVDNCALREEAAELREHKDATLALEQLQSEHRKLRLEWELSARRIKELSTEREELLLLRGDAEQQRVLAQEVKDLRCRERILEAQIYGIGQTPETLVRDSVPPPAVTGTRASEIEVGIASLLTQGQRTVVLADRQGFPIVANGERLTQDGLAAFSALAGDAAKRAETLMPLGTVQWLKVIDKNHTQISCRFFDCGTEHFTLSTIGQSVPSLETVDAVIATVMSKMTAESPESR